VRVTLLLCDSAQAVGDKLYILGGGWSFTGPAIAPMALAILVQVPWSDTNAPHPFRVELVDQDSNPIIIDNDPVLIEGTLEVGRPPGHPPGTSINIPLAFNIPSLALPAGQRFIWRVSINGDSQEDWEAAFHTRPAPPG
jgi:hypothetical protein